MSAAKLPKAKPSKAIADIRKHRLLLGANQMTFWKKYGTTQSGGSRYETGRGLPNAVAMLIVLQEQGVLSDEQLTAALAVVKASQR
jgi:hypothetical protein